MTLSYPDDSGGFEIVEAPDFAQAAEKIAGNLARWDEMRSGLDSWLHSRPTELPTCRQVRDDVWFARIASDPLVYLLYEVNERLRRVVYLDIRVVPPTLTSLDQDFHTLT